MTVGVAVGCGIAVAVGSGVNVGTDVAVAVGAGVDVAVGRGVDVGGGLYVAVGSGASVGKGVAVGRGVAVSTITIVGVGSGIVVGGSAVGAVGGVGVCVGAVSKPAPGRRDVWSWSFMEFKTSIPTMATNGMRDAAAIASQVAMPTPLKRECLARVSWWSRFGSCDDVPLSRVCELLSGIEWQVRCHTKSNTRFYCKTRELVCTHANRRRCGGHLHSAGRRKGYPSTACNRSGSWLPLRWLGLIWT